LAARQSPLGTLAQSLPRLGQVLANLRPTWHLRDLAALDRGFLEQQGIRGIVWDVDGTLTHFHQSTLADEVAPLRPLLDAGDLRHAILSNADEPRFRELGRIFPAIPIMKGYRHDGEVHIRVLRSESDSLPDAASLIDAGAVPLRKPDGALMQAAVAAMGLSPEEVVMVGDQYFTDIAGANLGGVRSIKVAAIGWRALPPGIRAGQRIERLVYRLLHGAPRWWSPS
jgi:predicted HAD superfamily phosphohydrolase YqeG